MLSAEAACVLCIEPGPNGNPLVAKSISSVTKDVLQSCWWDGLK
jgi:hypothetical protein